MPLWLEGHNLATEAQLPEKPLVLEEFGKIASATPSGRVNTFLHQLRLRGSVPARRSNCTGTHACQVRHGLHSVAAVDFPAPPHRMRLGSCQGRGKNYA